MADPSIPSLRALLCLSALTLGSSAAVAQWAAPSGGEAASGGGQPAGTPAPNSMPVSVQWGDFDGDAFLDALSVGAEGRLGLSQNRGDGGFVDVTATAGLDAITGVRLALFADGDRDGLADLFLSGTDGHQLLLNRGFGFRDVTPVGGFGLLGSVRSAHWVDYDRDGLFDLHVISDVENVLLHALGGWAFEAVPLSTITPAGAPGSEGWSAGQAQPGAEDASEGGPTPGAHGKAPDVTPSAQGPAGAVPLLTTAPPGTLDLRPDLAGGTASRPGEPTPYDASFCALSLADAASAGCLEASSVPTLGMLHPLSEDLFVQPNGRIGIGTTSPQAWVHIMERSGVGMGLLLEETAGTGTAAIIGLQNFARLWTLVSDSGPDDFRIEEDGVARLAIAPGGTVTTSGWLGVDTSAPATTLHVAGSTDTGLTSHGLLVAGDVDGLNLSLDANEVMARDDGVGSRLLLNGMGGNVTIGGQAGAADAFLGIGETAPQYPIHVEAGAAAVAYLDGSSGAEVRLNRDSTTGENTVRFYTGNAFDWVVGTDNSPAANASDFSIKRSNGSTPDLVVLQSNGNVGVNTTAPATYLHVGGDDDTSLTTHGMLVLGDLTGQNISIDGNEIMSRNNGAENFLHLNRDGGDIWLAAASDGRVGVGTDNPTERLDVNGAIRIRGGADIVESFESSCGLLEPGTVVAIDPDNPGRLMCSAEAYDTKVAGVVSGAGGVQPGLMLGQDELFSGDTKVAMTGRVYVKCTTEGGPVRPGDRLTTASLAGHAMRVTDDARAPGTVIGKAMSSLESGSGLVLVLVNLQ